ncbi:MAG: hypothetical protein HGB11_02215 [Chlorobiales bacterium]|nr:hypothetical protein [Chlorobiales bacterium]
MYVGLLIETTLGRDSPYIAWLAWPTFVVVLAVWWGSLVLVATSLRTFFRWASDRIDKDGVLCFITNRSFIDKRQDDGFRKCAGDEFNEIYVVDLGGDVRMNPKLSGTKHNVFGIQTGVAISFMVKKKGAKKQPAKIFYARRPEFDTAQDKLTFLGSTPFQDIEFEKITPDEKGNWLNLTDNDFDDLLPLATKETKLANEKRDEKAVFKLYTNGVVTNRDEWVYDFDVKNLECKMRFFTERYNANIGKRDFDAEIKWSRDLKNEANRGRKSKFNKSLISEVHYRPFVKQFYYSEYIFSDMLTSNHYEIFGQDLDKPNIVIGFLCVISSHPLALLASNRLIDLCLLKSGNGGTQMLSLYRYNESGNRIENITDWGLTEFQEHYGSKKITKEDIFHYTYAVLHNPAYREKYEQNLKREFPRLPFYEDFKKWAAWGKALMALHLGYESAKPYKLKRVDTEAENPKSKLKADKENGSIILDEATTLSGVPKEAWEYRLGNRSALEWILDQYKESTPKDPTIREKFDTYRFADYKEDVINLLTRVCAVSVETMKIIREMEAESGSEIQSEK